MGGVKRDGMKEVKLVGGVKSDKQTPLRRRRDLCRVPAGYITSHQNIFLTDDKQHTSHVPEQSIPGCRRRHDTHLIQPCVMDADVVHLPSLLSLGGPRPVLSPARTSSTIQAGSRISDEIVRRTPCAYICWYRALSCWSLEELHVHG
jgi:hypothetical protein